MLQLQNRDRQLLIFLEEHKAITTKQATNIFFDMLDKSAIRRLNQLENVGILTHYYRGKNKVYKLIDEKKELSEHDILIYDFYSWIYKNGGQVIEFKKDPHYFKGMLIPDALVKFKIPYNGINYTVLGLVLQILQGLDCWVEVFIEAFSHRLPGVLRLHIFNTFLKEKFVNLFLNANEHVLNVWLVVDKCTF